MPRRRRSLSLLWCLGLALAVTGCVGEREAVGPGVLVHVSPEGSDQGTGSTTDPVRTLQAAVDEVPATGGTVELADGSYPRQRVVLDQRRGVTIRAAAGAEPSLDATGLTPPRGESALVEIRGGSDITVQGLDLTGYRTRSAASVPQGILVTDGARDVRIVGNHVHHLGNDNPTSQSFETNAHGIAVYGRDRRRAITDLEITGNTVDHLVLGASEAVVVNGNVDGWSITDNEVHDNNNIGIDAIGFEDGITGEARYDEVNQARHGVIAGNVVTDIATSSNPAYDEDDGGTCTCAGGIYVDGGRSIMVRDNTVDRSDIGIEIAAEDPRGATADISVRSNTVRASRYVGLAVGGYSPARGEARRVLVSENTFIDNNTLADGASQVLVHYQVADSAFTDNDVTAVATDDPLLVEVLGSASGARKGPSSGIVIDDNTYTIKAAPSRPLFAWRGASLSGLAAWQQRSGQDTSSSIQRD